MKHCGLAQTTTGSDANAIALSDLDNSVFVVGGATARLVDGTRDFDGDGTVNFPDLGLMKGGFFLPSGPSGVPNACAGR